VPTLDLLRYRDNLTFRQVKGKTVVWDVVRKKNIILTPEELVRQLMVQWLHEEQKIPYSNMALERRLKIGTHFRRFDLLCYDKDANPYIMVECKAFEIKIDDRTALQASQYNQILLCPYLILSNGNETYIYKVKDSEITRVESLI
jgi:hypothetical protein